MNKVRIASGVAAILVGVFVWLGMPGTARADAPGWMHAQTSVALEPDDKADAILVYAEDILTVQQNGKIKHLTRRVYKILKAKGKEYGYAVADFDAETKVLGMKGWCIPAGGKDFEVKEKESLETALPGVANGELVSDVKAKILQVPAAEPGNYVGYEIEQEERPFVLQDMWRFQHEVPVKEARFTLQLPADWEYKGVWMNYPEVKATSVGNNQWQWVVKDVKAIRPEEDMPPWRAVAGQMLVTLLPPGGSSKKGFETWAEMGKWEWDLAQGRREASAEEKQKVTELTTGKTTSLAKMQALASFVQQDIRYVAIELGIGGWQPHPAKDIYGHKYGDCKDKATLLSSMLKEIGVESFYLSVNTTRGAVNAQTPPQMYLFNHEILGIKLPDDAKAEWLQAVYMHPTQGRVLIFDPTDNLTPFGLLSGGLQASYGLLVMQDTGDLIQLPMLPPAASGVRREGKFTLAADGTLKGRVNEVRVGDNAASHRYALRNVNTSTEMVKPLESQLAHSLGTFQISEATVANLKVPELPFEYAYTLTAPGYAKGGGGLMLVRPRVIGISTSDILERKEPRKYPVEFDGPEKDVSVFEITLPPGFEMEELPPPAVVEYSFATYKSESEMKGNVLRYTRTLEIKELSVPVSKLDELKKFYRVIAGDERNMAVLKPAGK